MSSLNKLNLEIEEADFIDKKRVNELKKMLEECE